MTKNRPTNRVTIRQRERDVDFMSSLRKAAKKHDRTPAHFARQIVIAGLIKLGELVPPSIK